MRLIPVAAVARNGRSAVRYGLTAAALALTMVSASADEPKGCDGFKWSVKQEAVLLQDPTMPVVPSGSMATIASTAFKLDLLDSSAAKLPKPPERSAKISPSKAGYVEFGAPKAGAYQITISAGAWIDLVQNGQYIKPSAFSGAVECPGVRKTIRANLAASPLTLQISGTQDASIGIVITPMPQ